MVGNVFGQILLKKKMCIFPTEFHHSHKYVHCTLYTALCKHTYIQTLCFCSTCVVYIITQMDFMKFSNKINTHRLKCAIKIRHFYVDRNNKSPPFLITYKESYCHFVEFIFWILWNEKLTIETLCCTVNANKLNNHVYLLETGALLKRFFYYKMGKFDDGGRLTIFVLCLRRFALIV